MSSKESLSTTSLNHRARKRFGQNFLHNPEIINRIVSVIAPQPGNNLVEIGPGRGALTSPLLEACPKLQVIEIDRDLIPGLLTNFAHYPDFKLYCEDALKMDFSRLTKDQPLRVVGNLPYNISTPLLFHLLSFHTGIEDMHFMLQKEVVDRLAAEPGNKHYGRLSIMVQYYCQVENLFRVAPECFRPQPKVNSAIVRLVPHANLPFVADNHHYFTQIVTTAFQQRRKTLRNSLKRLLTIKEINALPIDASLRPENLSVADYVRLSNSITHLI